MGGNTLLTAELRVAKEEDLKTLVGPGLEENISVEGLCCCSGM